MNKKSCSRKHCNKNTRKVSNKVKKDECPDGVCPIDKKKKKTKVVEPQYSQESHRSLWDSFLDFLFPSRLRS